MEKPNFSVHFGPTNGVPRYIGKYRCVRTIGKGSSSIVILVQHVNSKELFACKVVSRSFLVESNLIVRFEQELRIHQSLKHPNIVSLIEVIYDENFIYIVMEYCSNGELYQYIVENERLCESEAKRIFLSVISALDYVHSKNIAHRDIKPENILIDQNLIPKIADFGMCHETQNNTLLSTPCGSSFYVPPEIFGSKSYNGQARDIWSMGVVLFAMLTGSLPWTEGSEVSLFNQIQKCQIFVPDFVSNPAASLIKQILQKDPKSRPTASEILKDQWLNSPDINDPFKSTSSLCGRVTPSNSFVIKPSKKLNKVFLVRPTIRESKSAKCPGLPPVPIIVRKSPMAY